MDNVKEEQNINIYEDFQGLPPVNAIGLDEILSQLSKPAREKIISGYDIKQLAKVFEDEEMMRTVEAFLKNGMNVSRTARELYMHRNTLMYKLNALYRQTGFNLHDFDMAATFKILHTLYVLK